MDPEREAEAGTPAAANAKEHVMMFAFVLALIGIAVLKTLEHVAASA
jgi:hypothetical protein